MSDDGWQPIETAPMDGTPILLMLAEDVLGSRMHVGVFHHNTRLIAGHFHFDMPQPTRWRPLPAPPAAEE